VKTRGSEIRTNLVVLGTSVLIVLVIAELVCRMLLAPPLPWRYPQVHYRSDPDLLFTLAPDQEAFTADKPATGSISIADSTGNLAYSGTFTLNAGQQNFSWDGKGNNGTKWPDGNYKMTISAKDTSGNPVTVSTTVQGTVDSVDLSSTPPTLSIGGSNFTVDKIKNVVRPGL